LDVGIKSFLVTSEGEIWNNPQYLYQYQRPLTHAQRSVSRKKKGCSNRKKAVQRLAKIHLKIRNTRKDVQHKLSTRFIRQNQTIVGEDLKVSNLLKNPGGEPHPLAKAISDCGWYQFTQMLEYKAKWYSRTFIRRGRPAVAPHFTSQDCSTCSNRSSELTLADREWTCSSCGVIHDRDVNAAINIKTKGVGSTRTLLR
jgi:putative transposase